MVKDCTVPVQHPCVAGHFPGHPVVPGAYLTALVERLILEDMPQMRCAVMRKIKFPAPLKPGAKAELVYEVAADKVHFRVEACGQLVLEGSALLESV